MEINFINRQIDNCIEIRKNLWTTFIILTGGIASLMINLDNFSKLVLVIIGGISEIILMYMITEVNNELKNYLNKLKEV